LINFSIKKIPYKMKVKIVLMFLKTKQRKKKNMNNILISELLPTKEFTQDAQRS